MVDFLQKLGHAIAIGIVGTFTALNGSVMHPVAVPSWPQAQSATTSVAVALPPLPATDTDTLPPQATQTPPLASPPLTILPPSTTTTQIATATQAATSPSIPAKIIAAIKSAIAPKAKTARIVPSSITAQWVFANTTTTFQQTYAGPYEATLATMVNGKAVAWQFNATSFGGTDGIPLFTSDISCDPPPTTDPTSDNPLPLFSIASNYTCTISLTPYTGSDRRTQTETISFSTPAGQLTVSRAPSTNSLLVNNENDGGITFTNTDPHPVEITGLTFAVSYSYLSTTTRPLIMRLLTPGTDEQLSDYHLENLTSTAASPFTESNPGLNASVVFTIPGSSQKLLPIEMLGVTKMLMDNTTPDITITLKGITTDRPDLKTVLNDPEMTWSCDVILGNYNPNDPDASEECHN